MCPGLERLHLSTFFLDMDKDGDPATLSCADGGIVPALAKLTGLERLSFHPVGRYGLAPSSVGCSAVSVGCSTVSAGSSTGGSSGSSCSSTRFADVASCWEEEYRDEEYSMAVRGLTALSVLSSLSFLEVGRTGHSVDARFVLGVVCAMRAECGSGSHR